MVKLLQYADEIVWRRFPDNRPMFPGKYLVYRQSCKKLYFETWNGTGWAYNNNDITHFTIIINPDPWESR